LTPLSNFSTAAFRISQILTFPSLSKASNEMASGLSNVLEEHHSVTWPVTSFTVDHDFKSPNHAFLLLDRANSELGLFYHIAPGVGLMAQLTDNEPVYFQVSSIRAACSRPGQTCKKVCVLMQHSQIDLEFTTSDHASDFLHSLGRLATKVGNLSFEVFEAQSYVSAPLEFFSWR
jgi:histone acetyltransferase HTATIP